MGVTTTVAIPRQKPRAASVQVKQQTEDQNCSDETRNLFLVTDSQFLLHCK